MALRFEGAVGIQVVAAVAGLALVIVQDDPFDAPVTVPVGFLFHGKVVAVGDPDVDLTVSVGIPGGADQPAFIELVAGVEVPVRGGIPLHGPGALLTVKFNHLLQMARFSGDAFMPHPLFPLKPVPGVDGAVMVPITFKGRQPAIAVKLEPVETSIPVAVNLQPDWFALLVEIGDLVDLPVPVCVSFHARILGGCRTNADSRNTDRQDGQENQKIVESLCEHILNHAFKNIRPPLSAPNCDEGGGFHFTGELIANSLSFCLCQH